MKQTTEKYANKAKNVGGSTLNTAAFHLSPERETNIHAQSREAYSKQRKDTVVLRWERGSKGVQDTDKLEQWTRRNDPRAHVSLKGAGHAGPWRICMHFTVRPVGSHKRVTAISRAVRQPNFLLSRSLSPVMNGLQMCQYRVGAPVRKLFQWQGRWNGAQYKKLVLELEKIKGLEMCFGA